MLHVQGIGKGTGKGTFSGLGNRGVGFAFLPLRLDVRSLDMTAKGLG